MMTLQIQRKGSTQIFDPMCVQKMHTFQVGSQLVIAPFETTVHGPAQHSCSRLGIQTLEGFHIYDCHPQKLALTHLTTQNNNYKHKMYIFLMCVAYLTFSAEL